jgi:hypothetical protein
VAEVVNLRRVRKRVEREQKEATAQRNRVAHGLSKAERKLGQARTEQAQRQLEAHRREPRDGE